ncbi:MAG: DNA mismatch repair endonuclease MutL [Bacteroidetes bacterium]|nr:DNA mismatch repair endonuclease MutL [Bacteroidota bacterium]MCL2303420.1 DNA mismatch repair endonuclease MutL [Lentimicrobiaceae bacterium]
MNTIHLLPDIVANQIAAGEVIQRPASAVKELLENTIDAGATKVQLIIKDAGRTLIQVVDNGKGMAFTDARMCFERHATSKIATADDLFHLTTKGFRGEALASIAAIAQIELNTKRAEEETGTRILVEGSQIKEHAPTATQDGTSIAVKNLFFNVPARRNFLKSDAVELGHIEEELNRLSLIHYDIEFSFYHNGKLMQQLQPSNQKQRIINVFGTHFKDKLFPVELNTEAVKITGFIAKPENAKKKKNEQYLFVNNRFVKHYLLTHAIETAYKELIPEGHKPAFFIEITVPPATIDVNISPTKIDVKFQDDRMIYAFLNAAVKKTLGALSLVPQIDFNYNPDYDFSAIKSREHIKPPTLTLNPNYTPYTSKPEKKNTVSDSWQQFLSGLKNETVKSHCEEPEKLAFTDEPKEKEEIIDETQLKCLLFSDAYLVFLWNDALHVIDVKAARERILFEHFLHALENAPIVIQQSMFPETITLSASATEIVNDLLSELRALGYDLEQMDRTSFAVNGTPGEDESCNVQQIIEQFVEMYKTHQFLHKTDKNCAIAKSLARQKCGSKLQIASELEQQAFVKQWLQCQVPHISPSGKKVVKSFMSMEIQKLFE